MDKLYDIFHDVNNNLIMNVRCYNDAGGTKSTFNKGEYVPQEKLNNDFDPIAFYGKNYNIFDYENGLVVLIRNGIYIGLNTVNDIKEIDVNGYLCIDVTGDQIEVDKVKDYIDVIAEYQESLIERNNYLKIMKEALSNNKSQNKKGIINIIKHKVMSFF